MTRNNFCTSCGKPTTWKGTFCIHCGAAVKPTPKPPESTATATVTEVHLKPSVVKPTVQYLPENIMANLARYGDHETSICPSCGYSGLVGYIGDKYPGGWILFLIGLLFIWCPLGWSTLIYQYLGKKHKLGCPNCGATFLPNAGLGKYI